MTFLIKPERYELPINLLSITKTYDGYVVDMTDEDVEKAYQIVAEYEKFTDQTLTINLGVALIGYILSLLIGSIFIPKMNDVMAISLVGAVVGFFYSSFKRDSALKLIRQNLVTTLSKPNDQKELIDYRDKFIESNFQKIKNAITLLKIQLDGKAETGIHWWSGKKSYDLEKALCNMFLRRGFAAQITKGSGDGGVDVIVEGYQSNTLYIQCKGWSKKVGPQPIRELAGVVKSMGNPIAVGVVLSTQGFSEAAIQFARESSIQLWDSATLCEIAKKYPVS